MKSVIFVMIGGALGAAARYLVGQMIASGPKMPLLTVLPLGTLLCNVIGGVLMGALVGVLSRADNVLGLAAGDARLLLGVGLLGGFTTFSAFSLEAVQMLQNQQMGLFMAYIVLSVGGSIAALFAGLTLARIIA
jgi:fluoride exporter